MIEKTSFSKIYANFLKISYKSPKILFYFNLFIFMTFQAKTLYQIDPQKPIIKSNPSSKIEKRHIRNAEKTRQKNPFLTKGRTF